MNEPASIEGRARVAAPAGTSGAVTTIVPPTTWPGLGLDELWRLRAICVVLARRNLKVRYRQTLVGGAWAVLQPILLMGVFTIFFGLLARTPSGGLPYPVFFYLGLLPWQMVSKILAEGSASVVANAALVTRVYFPRVYFPTSVALASLVDLAFGFGALAVLLVIFGIVPGWPVVFLPLFVAVAWASGLGVAYWLSALNVAYRDVAQLLPFLAQLWMFASPVIYSSSIVPEPYRALYHLNPIALSVEGFRWAVGGAAPPPPEAWILGPFMAALLLVSGYLFFRKRERTFSDLV
ncbi:MAG: lipopolysaccharide transport system permease protein [Chloroflexota bacterium]|jgi:lipopolysaccharide transport system permease protein|nr:lipopolysaccharide transport system permease protein [Chloroflexota bacterium]